MYVCTAREGGGIAKVRWSKRWFDAIITQHFVKVGFGSRYDCPGRWPPQLNVGGVRPWAGRWGSFEQLRCHPRSSAYANNKKSMTDSSIIEIDEVLHFMTESGSLDRAGLSTATASCTSIRHSIYGNARNKVAEAQMQRTFV